MNNVLTVLGREFRLRDSFVMDINEEGVVDKITLQHLFENEVPMLRTLASAMEMIQENAQLSANRGQGRGVPMNEFKVQITQWFTDEQSHDNWRFEFTLTFHNGDAVYDDNADLSDDDPTEALSE